MVVEVNIASEAWLIYNMELPNLTISEGETRRRGLMIVSRDLGVELV